ncbi:superoxide dismutase family protein [Bacillus sp. FJAT-44742]|uniref:superoxide dismutase family protein n=1 Tax=Bacillus sp. FJAT-44742 TaxID=2014005 RepID=UPI000C246C3A|nr:superoxide dismutase family protein [Bacillus sp. FJAT-44742]
MKPYLLKSLPIALAAIVAAGCQTQDSPGTEDMQQPSDYDEDVDEMDEAEIPGGEAEPEAEPDTEEQNGEEQASIIGYYDETGDEVEAQAVMNTPNEEVGTVQFYTTAEDNVLVEANFVDLEVEPGYHGFHLHEEGVCEVDDDGEPFTSAGGHWNPDDEDHGSHAGDLPPVYINEDGTGYLLTKVDTFTSEQAAEDEIAVMLHEDPDNFAHIPDRYQSEDADEPGPDEATLATGDAGDRLACGVVETVEE